MPLSTMTTQSQHFATGMLSSRYNVTEIQQDPTGLYATQVKCNKPPGPSGPMAQMVPASYAAPPCGPRTPASTALSAPPPVDPTNLQTPPSAAMSTPPLINVTMGNSHSQVFTDALAAARVAQDAGTHPMTGADDPMIKQLNEQDRSDNH